MFKMAMSTFFGLALAWMSLGAAQAAHSAQYLRDDGYVLAPFSFVKFCIDYPGDCPSSGGASRVALTASRLAQLTAVNRSVNSAIAPTPDHSRFRFWRLNVAAGDCNAFAIQKRHELLAQGWPAGALALTVVKTPWGEGHLVLTVRTDRGDLVLDNLRPSIVSWLQSGYVYLMRQSSKNPQFWVELHGGQATRALWRVSQASADTPAVEADGGDQPSLGERAATAADEAAPDIGFPSKSNRAAPTSAGRQTPIRPSVRFEAPEVEAAIAFWLAQGDQVLRSVAPELREALRNALPLAKPGEPEEAPRPGSSTVGEIDPAAYGLM